MKLLDAGLPLPPLPPPTEPAPLDPSLQPSVETPRRGRPPGPLADPRMDDFTQYLRDQNNGVMTIGSYSAAVSSILRRGIPADAPDSALDGLSLSPSSLALYARAWRAWHRFLGVAPSVNEEAVLRRVALTLCNSAKGKKPKISDLKKCRWSGLGTIVLDKKQHFTLANDEHTWIWAATPDRMANLHALMRQTLGSELPDDPIELERVLDQIADRSIL